MNSEEGRRKGKIIMKKRALITILLVIAIFFGLLACEKKEKPEEVVKEKKILEKIEKTMEDEEKNEYPIRKAQRELPEIEGLYEVLGFSFGLYEEKKRDRIKDVRKYLKEIDSKKESKEVVYKGKKFIRTKRAYHHPGFRENEVIDPYISESIILNIDNRFYDYITGDLLEIQEDPFQYFKYTPVQNNKYYLAFKKDFFTMNLYDREGVLIVEYLQATECNFTKDMTYILQVRPMRGPLSSSLEQMIDLTNLKRTTAVDLKEKIGLTINNGVTGNFINSDENILITGNLYDVEKAYKEGIVEFYSMIYLFDIKGNMIWEKRLPYEFAYDRKYFYPFRYIDDRIFLRTPGKFYIIDLDGNIISDLDIPCVAYCINEKMKQIFIGYETKILMVDYSKGNIIEKRDIPIENGEIIDIVLSEESNSIGVLLRSKNNEFTFLILNYDYEIQFKDKLDSDTVDYDKYFLKTKGDIYIIYSTNGIIYEYKAK